ncbi:hypothetical protein L1887_32054 [Cichorium endivia]|nr:hypothetical protein L1887_32054 [Cichorium endivia]
MFEAGSTKESQLRDPLHRLMHRIISTSIMQRRGCEKVSGEDMFCMWVLSDPSRFLNLPYALAVSLTSRAAGASSSSPMAGGHLITRLARSYGILTAEVIAGLAPTQPIRAMRVAPPPPVQPPPQLANVLTVVRDLRERMEFVEEHLAWIADALLMLTQSGRPFPTRAHDDETGPSGTQHDD